MWATMAAIFTNFIVFATRTQQIYAGFAVVITTLIWLYLNWLILLIGAQLAFYHQRPAFLRIGRQEPKLSNAMRERLALNVMFLVGQSFRDSDKSISSQQVSAVLHIPSIALAPILEVLESAGLLTSTEKEALVPGREMSRIALTDILDVVRAQGETGSYRKPSWSGNIDALGDELDAAVAGVIGERTLADFLDETEQNKK